MIKKTMVEQRCRKIFSQHIFMKHRLSFDGLAKLLTQGNCNFAIFLATFCFVQT